MPDRYIAPSARAQALRMAHLRALYDSLPVEERERIDAECLRLRDLVRPCGPMTAFEIVMSVRMYLVKAVT